MLEVTCSNKPNFTVACVSYSVHHKYPSIFTPLYTRSVRITLKQWQCQAGDVALTGYCSAVAVATASPACSAICSLEKRPDDKSASYIRVISAAETRDTVLAAGASCLGLLEAMGILL